MVVLIPRHHENPQRSKKVTVPVPNPAAAVCRAFERNMDTEAVEQSIQEATASVRENVSMLERALLDVEEHTRYGMLLLCLMS